MLPISRSSETCAKQLLQHLKILHPEISHGWILWRGKLVIADHTSTKVRHLIWSWLQSCYDALRQYENNDPNHAKVNFK